MRFAITVVLLLGACTAAQIQTASVDVQAACADILPLAQMASLIPQAGSIASGVIVGCTTASGVARLASDPTSAAWLGMQAQMLKDLLKKAPVKL